MADARVYKLGLEALAKSPVQISITKQSIEVITQNVASTASNIQVYKIGVEVLKKTPGKVDLTKQSIEILAKNEANFAPIVTSKIGCEILARSPHIVQFTKQSIEILAKNIANVAPIKCIKFGMEILHRSGPHLDAPIALPSFWKVFAQNWAQEVSMESSYDTDVSKSYETLTEERISLRDRPYRILTLYWTGMSRDAIDQLVVFLRKMTDNQCFIPLYQDQIEITESSTLGTKYLYCHPKETRFCVNQRIAVVSIGNGMLPIDVQIYEIDEVNVNYLHTKTTLSKTYTPGIEIIFPCMDVEKHLEPQISMITDQVGEVSLQVQEITSKTALPPAWTGKPDIVYYYDDIPIFCWEPDWSSKPVIKFVREGEAAAKGRGVEVEVQGERYYKTHSFIMNL